MRNFTVINLTYIIITNRSASVKFGIIIEIEYQFPGRH